LLTSSDIKRRARDLGFDACGIAPAAAHPELQFFREWLDRGYAGTMTYLHRSAAKRADAHQVLPSAQSVIVTATLYQTDAPYSIECEDPEVAQIARYALGDDYHDVLGARLDELLEWMRRSSPEPFEARAYVDTGPVQERVYAQYAGLGWIGKNTCLISPELGSWIFLAEIICSLPLATDSPALDQCGTCSLCLEACPTAAIVAPGVLDATRCISYLTIEFRGELPAQPAIGSHVYGCDVCQEVCPWNGAAPISRDPAWQARPQWHAATLHALARMNDDELNDALEGSAMRRAKAQGLRRNVAAAIGNAAGVSGRPSDASSSGNVRVNSSAGRDDEKAGRSRY
jgi:epoxyqueuosine reductase